MTCQRCGGRIEGEMCSDQTCPFSDHEQDCERGWIGHPDHGNAEDAECTCWRRNLHNGDEVRIDNGQPGQIADDAPTVIIHTIQYHGNAARIRTIDGEEIECLVSEIH